jgi:photosystem II stability/assembly factor-like uncharacterized protein
VNGRILPVRLLAWAGIGLCLLGGRALVAQVPQQPAAQLPKPVNQLDDPVLKTFVWRSIGPANIGGRVDDIAVDENNPSTFYLGFATGGVWKTTNNGTTWTSIFDSVDRHPVSSVGDLALAPSNPKILYVGTGEPNNRQSSSFGAGVYKSTDAGETFEYIGLKETQTIARVVVHPKDPNIVYAAALGHLFGPNPERGLYKTTDGGKTWINTKFIDNDTGFTEVVMDPSNPNVLFAASYQRRRQPWGFNGGGPGSAIWKTTDGAKTWTKLTGSGLPDNPIIGRIGIDIARSKPSTIYASIEVGPSGGTGAGVNEDGTLVPPGQGRGGGGGGRGGPPPPPDPKKSGIWRSDDSGRTWKFQSNQGDRWMYYSQVRIDPTNPEIAYQGGAPFFKTVDGGKNWRTLGGIPHSDHHAFWINPRNNNHILLGNDGGLAASYDQGETWEYVNTMPLGQFYAISADMRKPYYVCGGLQDNGSWCGPSGTRSANGILNSDWFRIGGGDGFYTQNDPTDWTILYWESQDGNTSRSDLRAGRSTSIRPRPAGGGARGGFAPQAEPVTPAAAPPGQAQAGPAATSNVVPVPPPGTNYRFYWSTPFILSPHNPRTIYLGAERLFRSYNRGETWTASPDLTNNIGRNDRPIMGVAGTVPMASKHDGAASYSNIITISESPVIPGVLWVGTNDGNVQVSRDGGATWKNVVGNVKGVPREAHVSRVEASYFDGSTAYVSFDAHRTDDHKPYVFVTTDLGEAWTSISGNLPYGNVNVVKADPRNRNLLYVGTEYGFYISLTGGAEWKRFMNGLPAVRVDDVIVHPRENDLILATHGRSIWIMDDISALQQLSDETMKTDGTLLDIRPATAWINDIQKAILVEGAKHFRGQNPSRGSAISYWLKGAPADDVRITISDVAGREIRVIEGTKEAGLNRVHWDLAFPGGRGGRGGRGAAGGTAQAGAAPARAAQPAPGQPAQTAPAAGQPAGQPTGEQAAAGQRGAAPAAAQTGQAAQPGRGGGGRGGPAPTVPAGTYLVKVTVGDKVIGQKTIVVEADSLQ